VRAIHTQHSEYTQAGRTMSYHFKVFVGGVWDWETGNGKGGDRASKHRHVFLT